MHVAAKSLVETFRKENLPVGKVSSVFCGEYLGFDDRDCYNHLRNVRHRQLDMGMLSGSLIISEKKQYENHNSSMQFNVMRMTELLISFG